MQQNLHNCGVISQTIIYFTAFGLRYMLPYRHFILPQMTRLSDAIARNAPSVTYWRVMRNQYDMTSDMHACRAYVHCIPKHMTFRTQWSVSTRPPSIAAFERNQFLSAMARMKDHYQRRNVGHEGTDGRAQRRLSLLTM